MTELNSQQDSQSNHEDAQDELGQPTNHIPEHDWSAEHVRARPYWVACDLYARAFTLLADRAGVNSGAEKIVSAPGLVAEDAVRVAEQLALPSQRPDGYAVPHLISIMGRLHGETMTGYYAPEVMGNEAVMPLDASPSDLRRRYASLWQALTAESENSKSKRSTRIQAEIAERRSHALLQRYAWAAAAPPTVDDPPDAAVVSLYDYARIAAALAVCLDWHDDLPGEISSTEVAALQSEHEPQSATDGEPILLVGGDLSGLQDWLYTFGSAGAAKSLRGRSFYLQLLIEVIAHSLLDRLGLPSANLLYVGGGNFYLLAPASLAQAIDQLRQEISRKLLVMHSGALYMAVAHTPMPQAALTGEIEGGIGQCWDRVARKLNAQKARRFAELEAHEMAQAIGAALENTGRLEDTCRVCRRTITAHEQGRPITDAQGGRMCALCLSFLKLGELLPKARFLVWDCIKPQAAELVTDWQTGLRQFGYEIQPVHDAHSVANSDERRGGYRPVADTTRTTVYFWDTTPPYDEFPGSLPPERTVWAFRPLAQCTPETRPDEIATFEELRSAGIARWGVLRMDVDNLGRIFQRGIPANNLCRVAAVSGLMRHFFEGYVPHMAQARFNRVGDPRVYMMYAGGDDLFVVGGWSELPRLADAIRRAFAGFVCQNPQVTISGGISIALDANYPLYQAARAAGEAEDAAKDHGKNSLAFLGQPLGWNDEFPQVDLRQTQIRQWLETADEQAPRLARGFLMALRSLAAEWEQWRKQETGEHPVYRHGAHDLNGAPELYLGPWQWHLVYSLSRALDRVKDPTLEKDVHAYIQALLGGEIRLAGVTARWVELLTRSKEDLG